MLVLGISSATKLIGVSLIDDESIISEYSVLGGTSEDIVPYIDLTLEKAGVPLKKISCISVATGPGSYGGLRGGIAVAKTLSQTMGVSLVSVSTLEAIAYNLIEIDGTIFAVLDACKEDFNLALFASKNKNLNRLTDDMVLSLDKIIGTLSKIKGEAYLVCPHPGLTGRFLEAAPSTNIKIVPQAKSWPSAVNVALIGLARFKKGETEDYLTLIPHYSHKPNIREYKGPSKAEI